MKTIVFTQEELVEKCAEWQGILKLQDWTIAVGIVRDRQMKNKGQAEISYSLPKKMAIISLLDPIDYDNDTFPQDMEQSLVHELVHLHIASFDETESGSLEEIMLEQATDTIAKALVNVKRGGEA